MPMDVDKKALPNLTGDIFIFTFQDPDNDPNTVLEISTDWSVKVRWHIIGLGANNLAGADWHVKVKIESMGEGEEKTLRDVTVPGGNYDPATSTASHLDYEVTIPILARDPAVRLADRVNDEGVYRLVAVVTHDKVGGFPGPDRVAGFIEGPMLQFYAFQ